MPHRSAPPRSLPALLTLLGLAVAGAGHVNIRALQVAGATPGQAANASPPTPVLQQTLGKYCVTCHNGTLKTGGLSIDRLNVGDVAADAPQWEKIATKLRTGEMPPPGRPRPDAATYSRVAAALERALDDAAAA